ncbi:MAG: helix-turn-helix domain-containing protein [Egibacteraceae bacterium]
MDADPGLLGELRELRGRSVEQVAEICQVDRSTVERWESGDTKPYPRNRRALAAALGVPLGLLVRAVWGRTQQERQMHRRHLLRIVMGLPALALPNLADQPDFDLHETTVRLVGRYATAAPAELLTDARIHLDTLTAALKAAMLSGQRRQVLADATSTAGLAARAAEMAGHPGEGAAYLRLIRSLAEESYVNRLCGCALFQAADALSPVWGDSDPLAALDLLNAAAPLVGSRGLVAMEIAMTQAESYAALGREREALAAIDLAETAGVDDDGEGFFSAAGWFAGDEDPHMMAGWQGFCHLLLKRADEGLALLNHALTVPHANARATADWLSNVALGHTIAGDPEPACQAAVRSLDVSEATGYRAGIQRIHIVRDRMPEEWADTACVRALDERLRLAA